MSDPIQDQLQDEGNIGSDVVGDNAIEESTPDVLPVDPIDAMLEFMPDDIAPRVEGIPVDESGNEIEPGATTKPDPVTNVIPDVENPESFKYHQRKASLAEAENRLLREQIMSVSAASNGQPLVNPSASMGQTQQETPKAPLQRPIVPTRPANYDPIDAESDPDSASFKFERAKEQHFEDLAEYIDQRDQQHEVRLEYQEAQRQYDIEVDAARGQEQSLRAQLRDGYGMDVEQQNEFISDMTKPESITVDNLVRLHRARKGISQQPQQRQRLQTSLPPVPSSTGSQAGRIAAKSTQDALVDDMVAFDKPLMNIREI